MTQSEYRQYCSDNYNESSSFLSGSRSSYVNKLCSLKTYAGKVSIPIGIVEMKVKRAEMKSTRNGGTMLHLQLWAKPHKGTDDKPISLSPIECYHVQKNTSLGSIKDNWFKRFTVCLDESQLNILSKSQGKSFKAVVMQTEEYIVNNGEVALYEGGVLHGKPIIVYQSSIVATFPLHVNDDDIKFNYYDLYQSI